MTRFALKSILRALIVFIVVTFVTFTLVFSNGRRIARGVLGVNATEADVDRLAASLGLDQPTIVQYVRWLSGFFTGDLGKSYFTSQEVTTTLTTRIPVTLSLVVLTLILTVVLAVAMGTAAAVFGGWLDRLIQFLSVVGTAIPSFVVAIAAVFAFAIALSWFPATGYVSPANGVDGWLASLTLPVFAILVGSIGGSASQFRGAVKDELRRDYVRTLRSRGMRESAIVFQHVLRNAGSAGVTILSLQAIGLLGGAVFVEQVFALPGLGNLSLSATLRGDIPVLMGCVVVTVVIVAVVNLVTDLVNAALNPKVRLA